MKLTRSAHNDVISRVSDLFSQCRECIQSDDENGRIHKMGQLQGILFVAQFASDKAISQHVNDTILSLNDIEAYHEIQRIKAKRESQH